MKQISDYLSKLTEYSRRGARYPINLKNNGDFMRKYSLCIESKKSPALLTIGGHGDVFYRLQDENWVFATRWANAIRNGQGMVTLNTSPTDLRKRLLTVQALGCSPMQLKNAVDKRRAVFATTDEYAKGLSFDSFAKPSGLWEEISFYLKDPTEPQNYLEEVCADAAIDFFRACSFFPGQKLSTPSFLVYSFLQAWSSEARKSYNQMVDFFGLDRCNPHLMPIFDPHSKDPESMLANARTKRALKYVENSAPTENGFIPNLYRVDEFMDVTDRYNINLSRSDSEASAYSYLCKSIVANQTGFEVRQSDWSIVYGTQTEYAMQQHHHMPKSLTDGVAQLRNHYFLYARDKGIRGASPKKYELQKYARDASPDAPRKLFNSLNPMSLFSTLEACGQ